MKAKQEEIDKTKQEIVGLRGKTNQCNLDLKTAHDDIAVEENEKKGLQGSLEKVTHIVHTYKCNMRTYVYIHTYMYIWIYIIKYDSIYIIVEIDLKK